MQRSENMLSLLMVILLHDMNIVNYILPLFLYETFITIILIGFIACVYVVFRKEDKK